MSRLRDKSTEDFNDLHHKFAEKMRAAGVTSLDRVAIAVSGGADSMALCILTARWKGLMPSEESAVKECKSGGLIGFVVDHNLRAGSSEEALQVQKWVWNLGLKCEILTCAWREGSPVLGHLQESARKARYGLLAQACQDNGVHVLLTAHHADDQAELFILRLSRCSGIAGLAGMSSAITLHPGWSTWAMNSPIPLSLCLIRPLLTFVKDDLYTICQLSGQDWVEDPTNQNLTFARNRIRKALQGPPFVAIREEIQHLIAFCRKSRGTLDRDRDQFLFDLAQVSQEWGHVTIDIEKLASSGASVAVLHRVIAALLQFVTQKAKPPRGRAVDGLLEYLRVNPLKGAYTVGGCNIFPDPGSKGSKAIICFSPDSPLPLATVGVLMSHFDQNYTFTRLHPASLLDEENLTDDKDTNIISKAISKLTVGVKTPGLAINEFKSLGLISGVGASLLQELTLDLSKDMSKPLDEEIKGTLNVPGKSTSGAGLKKPISFGEYQYFMDRFIVSLSSRGTELDMLKVRGSSSNFDTAALLGGCMLRTRPTLWIRHFEERDWLYLTSLVNRKSDQNVMMACKRDAVVTLNNPQRQEQSTYQRCSSSTPRNAPDQVHEVESLPRCWCHLQRFSKSKRALVRLRNIPKLVRRGLPVFVTAQGLLLGIPSVGFGHCPLVAMDAKFCPRVPLCGFKASSP